MLARFLLSGSNVEEVRIFYSYSRADAEFRSLIDDVLSRFKWDVDVRAWYDGDIPAGSEWEEQVFHHLDSAHIIILFVTKQFVRSEYCMKVEVPRSMARHERGEATVIPVLLERTDPDWQSMPFARLQALPSNGRPVAEWSDRGQAVRSVIQRIVDIIADAHLDAADRCRWQLHLDGSPGDVDDDDQLALVESLRTISQDGTMRPLALGEGSIVFLMESTRAGLRTFKNWFRDEKSPRIAGIQVLQIIELFGAGVHASAKRLADDTAVGKKYPDRGLLLFPSQHHAPPVLRGITISEEDPLSPHFTIDDGDSKLTGIALASELNRVVDYFMTVAAVPEEDLWVNLAPDDSNRMLPKSLAGTTLGRDMLELDFDLKRLAASLMHPDCDTGRAFWREVLKCEWQHHRTAAEDLSTFQRVWIVPSKATVYEEFKPEEAQNTAFVGDEHLKVMCEDDYLAKYAGDDQTGEIRNTNALCTRLFKDIILPVIEEEVNKGRTFAREQQIYHSLILASWLKNRYREHPVWSRYLNSGNPRQFASTVTGIHPFVPAKHAECGETGQERTASTVSSLEDDAPVDGEVGEEHLEKAISLREAGQHEEARRQLQDLVDKNINVHGKAINETQVAMSQLGRTLRSMGELAAAREIHEEVLSIRRYVLGDDHPYTLESMEVLADTLLMVGEHEAAAKLREETAYRRERSSDAFCIKENREYYEKYMRVFRDGVFHLVRDEYGHGGDTNVRVTRSYFAGAIDFRTLRLRVVRR